MTTTTVDDSRQNPSFMRQLYAWMAIPIIMFTFYGIDHSWDASKYSKVMLGLYDGTQNRTADRMENVNPGSATNRLVLASYGLLGLAIAAPVRMRSTPLLFAMLGYYGWLCCTVLWTSDFDVTAYKLLVMGVFLFSALGISRQLSLQQLGACFAAICAIYIVFGVFAEFSHGEFRITSSAYRFTGTTHANTQAVYGSVLCLFSSLIMFGKGKSFLRLAIALFVLGFVCLLFTKSRTSVAALIIGLTAIAVLHVRGKYRVPFISGVMIALSFGALVASLVGNHVLGKVGTAAAMGREDDLTTLTGRVPLWEELLDSIWQSPVIGHGYMAYWDTDQVEYLSELLKWEIPHGHNVYLDITLDGGIVAVLLFVTMMVIALITATRCFVATRDPGAVFAVGLIVFVLLHGCGESLFKLMVFPNFVLTTILFRMLWRSATPTVPEPSTADESHVGSPELVGIRR